MEYCEEDFNLFFCYCNTEINCKIHTFLFNLNCSIALMADFCDINVIPSFIKLYMNQYSQHTVCIPSYLEEKTAYFLFVNESIESNFKIDFCLSVFKILQQLWNNDDKITLFEYYDEDKYDIDHFNKMVPCLNTLEYPLKLRKIIVLKCLQSGNLYKVGKIIYFVYSL